MTSAGRRRSGHGVAAVGLGFGAEFVPLYQAHPGVERVAAVIDPAPRRRDEVGNRYDVEHRLENLDAVLADDSWDAVHRLSPGAVPRRAGRGGTGREGPLTLFEPRGRPARRSVVHPPDRTDVLPPPLRPFVSEMTDYPPGGTAMRPVYHGSSRPFLVHEFVTSVVEGHPSRGDAPTAGAWTAPGVCAHDSALRGGTPVAVPTY